MNELKIQYKKYTTRLKSMVTPSVYTKSGIRPSHDWQIILEVFFVGLLVVFGITLYLYMQVSNGSFVIQNAQDQSVAVYTLNQNDLKKITDYFTQKTTTLQTDGTSLKIPVNPAL